MIRRYFPLLTLLFATLAPVTALAGGAAADSAVFTSPEAAVQSLAAAVRAGDPERICAVIGPGSAAWLLSGDPVADRREWANFLAAYDQAHTLVAPGDDQRQLLVGADGWSFPAPLIRRGQTWRFDSVAGAEELLNRRIGRNELATIATLHAIVDAQREYAAADPDGNGLADYARRFISSEGKRDGLYWPAPAAGPESPLGPLIGAAAREGYGMSGAPAPYHGYHFRILDAQGGAARGGAYDYLVGEWLLGGFAVIAWPATYGVSGVMSFIVNHDGTIYERDLGAKTDQAVAQLDRFDPSAGWRPAEEAAAP